jgi:hypothetical protein
LVPRVSKVPLLIVASVGVVTIGPLAGLALVKKRIVLARWSRS